LIGHLFNYGLFGVLSTQVYIYTMAFPNDPRKLKTIVYGLYLLECLQVAIATRDAFETLGAGWGNLEALNNPQLIWFETPVMSGFISACVQLFFAWRVYILSKSKLLAGLISTLAVGQGVAAIVAGVTVNNLGNVSEVQAKAFKPTCVWLGGSAVCDIIIAGCMVYFLSRSHTGYANTDRVLSRLVRLTVETGLMTASVATIDLILFLVFQHNSVHLIPALTLAKLYTNSLMTLFNNRAQISKTTSHHGGASGGPSISLKPMDVNLSRAGRSGIQSRAHNPPTLVTTTVETVIDTGEPTGHGVKLNVSIMLKFHNIRSNLISTGL
ncbi:hypothetical protein JB92DRAFT_2752710, partial [Gautieria morchelliformis]